LNSSPVRKLTDEVRDEVDSIIRNALTEDIGAGDVTTDSIVPEDSVLEGRFTAKSAGVIAGWDIAARTFCAIDEHVVVTPLVGDGESATKGEELGRIAGPGRAILCGERVALNFMQRMSGIATTARQYVEAVKGTDAIILDTRKTVPGLRVLDKLAVRIGGAQNHRTGLYDMVLIKDNHIAQAGGVTPAVERVRSKIGRSMMIEIEVRTLEELREALSLRPGRILLDNMTIEMMKEAVRIADHRVPLEASGNVSLVNVAAVAATGVDYISVGALTHSVTAMDISLMINR